MVKCSACKKKYSPKRAEQHRLLIRLFSQDETALEASRQSGLTYATVIKYYQQLRKHCARFCETEYHNNRSSESEYEEYLYIEKSKRSRQGAIFDAHNILIFRYGDSVYTLLMPSLSLFKHQFMADDLEELYLKEFSSFMRKSKIIKIAEHDNTITKFWHYFDRFITPYKGVSAEYFPYYLKEAEFKFNIPPDKRIAILERLAFRPNGSDI